MMSSYRQEDSATEERIAQILSDAQIAMQAKQSQEKVLAISSVLVRLCWNPGVEAQAFQSLTTHVSCLRAGILKC